MMAGRFTVTEFEFPRPWFAVKDNDRDFHTGSYATYEEAVGVARDANERAATR